MRLVTAKVTSVTAAKSLIPNRQVGRLRSRLELQIFEVLAEGTTQV